MHFSKVVTYRANFETGTAFPNVAISVSAIVEPLNFNTYTIGR